MNAKVVYIHSQIACALIRMEAMKAANQDKRDKGEAATYGEEAFMSLMDEFCVSHNAVLGYLQE